MYLMKALHNIRAALRFFDIFPLMGIMRSKSFMKFEFLTLTFLKFSLWILNKWKAQYNIKVTSIIKKRLDLDMINFLRVVFAITLNISLWAVHK